MFLILFENFMDSFKNISIDSFEDFLVDQDRQFQNSPNFRIDSFRFFWTYIHPWPHGQDGGVQITPFGSEERQP